MPLTSVETRNVKYKGCPPNCRHIVIVRPDGTELAALLPVDPSWDVSVFVEAEFYRFFAVAVSPDKEELRIERWLPRHGPTRVLATTQAEQAAALNGKHAGNATHAELADEAVAALTGDDSPAPVKPRSATLMPMVAGDPEGGTNKEKRGEYGFMESDARTLIEFRAPGMLSQQRLTTKATEAEVLEAFCHEDRRSAYFLFDRGSDYFLEAMEFWGGKYRRHEATSTKASLPGLSNEDIVKAMVPNLAQGA